MLNEKRSLEMKCQKRISSLVDTEIVNNKRGAEEENLSPLDSLYKEAIDRFGQVYDAIEEVHMKHVKYLRRQRNIRPRIFNLRHAV